MILAVGKEHDGLVLALALLKRAHGQPHRVTNGRSLDGYGSGVQHVEKQLYGTIVRRQRALDKSLTRKDHQPDPVAPEQVQQAANLVFGPRQATRLDVLGLHTTRHVEHQHHVHALALDHFELCAELGAGQREDRKKGSQSQ